MVEGGLRATEPCGNWSKPLSFPVLSQLMSRTTFCTCWSWYESLLLCLPKVVHACHVFSLWQAKFKRQ